MFAMYLLQVIKTTEYGWVQEDGLKPLWFVGPQFPPSLTRASRKRNTEWRKPLGMMLIQRSQMQRKLSLRSQCAPVERRHLKV